MRRPKPAAARAAALFILLAAGGASITWGAFLLSDAAGFIVGGALTILLALFLAYLSGQAPQ